MTVTGGHVAASRAAWEDAVYAALPLPAAGAVMRLARYMTWRDGQGTSGRPSVQRLALECHVSERTVRRHLDAAVAAGVLLETAPHSPHRPTTYRSRLPADQATPDTGDRCAAPATPDTRDRCAPSHRTPVTATPDTGDRDTGHPCPPTSPETSKTSSLSAREEASPVHTATTRETTSDGDTFGTRALAALGRADLSTYQLDQAHKRACDRLGLVLAADAVHAVASLPNVRNLAAYMASLSDDDLRALAEQRKGDRERTARRSSTGSSAPTRYRCEHGHANGLRRSADGGSPCAACDGATPVRVPVTAVSA